MIVDQLSPVFFYSSDWLTHISAIVLNITFNDKIFPRIYYDLLVGLVYPGMYSLFHLFLQKGLRRKPSQFIISNLTSSTLYCLKVQAYTKTYNKTSAFSNVTCIKTAKGMLTFDLKYLISRLAFFSIYIEPVRYIRVSKCKITFITFKRTATSKYSQTWKQIFNNITVILWNDFEKDSKGLYFIIWQIQ